MKVLDEERIAERVSTGARFLDERFPGWEQRIDLTTLDVASGTQCVLAQTFRVFVGDHSVYCGCGYCNGYGNACSFLNLGQRDAQNYGFQALLVAQSGGLAEYDLLTQQWRIEVVKRRAAKVDADKSTRQYIEQFQKRVNAFLAV